MLFAVGSFALHLSGRAPATMLKGGRPSTVKMATELKMPSPLTQLEQMATMTTLSIDTGDLDIIEAYGKAGLITDATTNPLFVSQAGLSGDKRYVAFVDSAMAYARANAEGPEAQLELSMDRLAVELGLEIVKLVPGYVSTEVDIRASFDTEESLRRARRIIAMYEAAGVDRSRILIKLAGTWEGIAAARILEKEGITCNITLIFGFIQAPALHMHSICTAYALHPHTAAYHATATTLQAVAAAQAGARLISPFPGRIKDWHAANGGEATYEPSEDPGVVCVSRMHSYYKKYGHEKTICMPASWRPSRGTADPTFAIDEIVALAGVDRMTIGPPLLELLAASTEPLVRMLEPQAASAACADDLVGALAHASNRPLHPAAPNQACAVLRHADASARRGKPLRGRLPAGAQRGRLRHDQDGRRDQRLCRRDAQARGEPALEAIAYCGQHVAPHPRAPPRADQSLSELYAISVDRCT